MFREEENCRSSGRNGIPGHGFDPRVANKIFSREWARQVTGVSRPLIIKTVHPIWFISLIVVTKRIIYHTPTRKRAKHCSMSSLGWKTEHFFFTLKRVDNSKTLFSLIFQMGTTIEKNTRNVVDSGAGM